MRKRDAETQRTQGLRGGLYGGIDDNTTACRCLVLLLLSQRQLPSASVFAHKKAKIRSICTWWLKVRRRDAEHLHVMARSAKKGRRDAKDAEDAEACVVACMVVSMITLPLVVALFCSCYRKGNFQALVCTTTRMQRRGAYARGG